MPPAFSSSGSDGGGRRRFSAVIVSELPAFPPAGFPHTRLSALVISLLLRDSVFPFFAYFAANCDRENPALFMCECAFAAISPLLSALNVCEFCRSGNYEVHTLISRLIMCKYARRKAKSCPT